jgi:hypothetical protein
MGSLVEMERGRGRRARDQPARRDHVPRRRVLRQHLAQGRALVDDEVGVAPDLEPVPGDSQHVGGRRGHRVVDELDARAVDSLEGVRGEERDLQHVVSPERVVGVLDVVLAERDRNAHRGELPHRKVQWPGVRVADEPEPGAPRESRQPLQGGPGVETDRTCVVGDAAADQAVLEHRRGEHLGGAQARVAGVVDEHRDPPALLSGQRAQPAHVLRRVGVGVLDPRDPAHHVGAQLDRLADQLLRPRVAQQPVLRERHHLQVDDPAELLAQREQRDHALQPRRGVDVGEGEHVPDAVPHRLEHGPPGVGLDPGPVVVVLDRRSELDRMHCRAHVA